MSGGELHVKIDGLSDAIQEIVGEYSEEVTKCIDLSMDKVKKITIKKLKETSPKGKVKRGKKYAKSWASKKEIGRLTNHIIIYNRQGQLTHLLEKGHMEFNQHGGAYGRTKAQPHIEPAQEEAKEELIKEVTKRIEQI